MAVLALADYRTAIIGCGREESFITPSILVSGILSHCITIFFFHFHILTGTDTISRLNQGNFFLSIFVSFHNMYVHTRGRLR